MSIVEFLLARIADDEEAAKNAALDMGSGFGEERIRTGAKWSARYHEVWTLRNPEGSRRPVVEGAPLGLSVAKHIARHDPARVLAECEAKRRIVELRPAPTDLGKWQPDGGDGLYLDGDPQFWYATCWADNTAVASIYDGPRMEGWEIATSGIFKCATQIECMVRIEQWIREALPSADPILRALAFIYREHPDWKAEWRP